MNSPRKPRRVDFGSIVSSEDTQLTEALRQPFGKLKLLRLKSYEALNNLSVREQDVTQPVDEEEKGDSASALEKARQPGTRKDSAETVESEARDDLEHAGEAFLEILQSRLPEPREDIPLGDLNIEGKQLTETEALETAANRALALANLAESDENHNRKEELLLDLGAGTDGISRDIFNGSIGINAEIQSIRQQQARRYVDEIEGIIRTYLWQAVQDNRLGLSDGSIASLEGLDRGNVESLIESGQETLDSQSPITGHGSFAAESDDFRPEQDEKLSAHERELEEEEYDSPLSRRSDQRQRDSYGPDEGED